MDKGSTNIALQCKSLIGDIREGKLKPVYLLMGDEPYYLEQVFAEILAFCVPEEDRDFNQTVCYGSDISVEQIVSAARRFPMMAERQLVAVKEAQLIKDIENLSVYCADPLDTTVLVIMMSKASADKRKSLYKSVLKNGVVVESPLIREYEVPEWISAHIASKGMQIEPRAAALFGESAGSDLSAIAQEADKLIKNLPEGTKIISVEDVERNIGVSRQFSIFELTRALSTRNASAVLKTAVRLGDSARFAIPAAVSMLYIHFNRILKCSALIESKGYLSPEDKSRALPGVNPYFHKEYVDAARFYSSRQAMAAISLLCEYDYKGKGGDGEATAPGELLRELCLKLLCL